MIETQVFGTANRELDRMRQWVVGSGCQSVVMASTGSYWKPVFHMLERCLAVHLANPLHVKNLRGHKTDVADSVWLAHLLRHGMVRASFIPPGEIRKLRDLTRRRKRLIGAGASEKNRIVKTLEDAQVKLTSVLSNVFGVSGQAMLERMLDGEFQPAELAEFTKAQARIKRPEIVEALEGHRFDDHHRLLIRQSLDHIAFMEQQIADLDAQIVKLLRSYKEQYELLQTIPGIKAETAAVILAELGPDMSVFASEGARSGMIVDRKSGRMVDTFGGGNRTADRGQECPGKRAVEWKKERSSCWRCSAGRCRWRRRTGAMGFPARRDTSGWSGTKRGASRRWPTGVMHRSTGPMPGTKESGKSCWNNAGSIPVGGRRSCGGNWGKPRPGRRR